MVAGREKSALLREAVVIAAVPALGWTAAYVYDFGRAQALGIPTALISVSLSDVLHTAVAVLAVLAILFQFVLSLLNFNRPMSSLFEALSRRWELAPVALIVPGLVVARASWLWWVYFLGGYLGTILLSMVLSRIAFAFKHSRGRLSAATATEFQWTATDNLLEKLGLSNFISAFVVGLALLYAFAAGIGSGVNQSVYFEIPNTHYVLVADYSGNLVFESHSGSKLNGDVLVVPAADRQETKLVAERLGHLASPRICDYGC